MDEYILSDICPLGYCPSAHHLPPGTVLRDRYMVGRILGEGGFGITYLGIDRLLNIKIAIKEFFPTSCCARHAASSPKVTVLKGISEKIFARGMNKYMQEAQILAGLSKIPVIVNVRDYFEENNTAYIVMEYIEGITLKELVEGGRNVGEGISGEGHRIEPEVLFALIAPVMDALSAVHEAGILHRDLCPDNLMLEGGRLRLIDFGCAREAQTQLGTQTLTLRHGYAPIEQYQQNSTQGPWTDIYALCALIYFCLTGVVPPLSTDRITRDCLKPPSQLGAAISKTQERALLKGLRIRPNQRFRTVKELKEALFSIA